ncbi:hypothetical protein B0J18DRAFT_303122 [Chaetomium sp. MPI-SDFR-AT-0129]|nr:hypothetical protein B0J18DRAFT_303122 [Chaetomium sp. MPI-SDFR-AT-0129]
MPDNCGLGASSDDLSALSRLGYPPYLHSAVLGHDSNPGWKTMEEGDGEQSEELKFAVRLLSEFEKHIDYLVNDWLNRKHHQSYALDPAEFRRQYDRWGGTPRDKVTAGFTSLILRVCACSLDFIDKDRATELNVPDVQGLANRVHTAAEKLGDSIPPGKGGLAQVQQLLLTAIWLESSEKRTEAWHALGKAIMAAYELGLHQPSPPMGVSESEQETRIRTWVILSLLDCELSHELSGELSRPPHVNLADPKIELPPPLEGNPGRLNRPSLFRHLELHYQLRVVVAKAVAQLGCHSTREEMEKQTTHVIVNWREQLPKEYALIRPDTRWDCEYKWVVRQREYLGMIAGAALVRHTSPRDNQEKISVFEVLKDNLGMFARTRSEVNLPFPAVPNPHPHRPHV